MQKPVVLLVALVVFATYCAAAKLGVVPAFLKSGLDQLEAMLQRDQASFNIQEFNPDTLLTIERRLHTFQDSRKSSEYLRQLISMTGQQCDPTAPVVLDQLWRVTRNSQKYVAKGGRHESRRIVDQIIDHYAAILASKCIHELAGAYNRVVERTPRDLVENLYLISPENYEPKFNEWLDVDYSIKKRQIFAQLTEQSGSDLFKSDDYQIPSLWTPFFLNTYQDLLHQYLFQPCELFIEHVEPWVDQFQAYLAFYPYSSGSPPTDQMIREEFFDKLPDQFRRAMFARWLCRNAPRLIGQK